MELYIVALSLTPATLTRIIDQVKPDRYSDRLPVDRFSLSEMVAHIADCEEVFQDRMRLAHEHPGSHVEGFDPDERARTHHYADKDLHHELVVFENRRRDTVDFLKSLQGEDWSKTVKHSQWGEMTIAVMASIIIGHDVYHLDQASQYMR
jgi:uncharacterized damage-inducible protein DinB